jgi:UDP-glucose 4-epimerase
MKVLIIGGCGFIGSHVVDVLKERATQIRVLDRRPETFRQPVPGVDYIRGDLSEVALVTEAVLGMDAVIHLASSTVPYTSNLDPVGDIVDNLVGSVRLLEVMRSVGVRNILYLSSGGTVYGIPQHLPVTEDHPLQPLNSYGIIKVSVEKYLHMYGHLHGLRYCILRASNPYGPRQGHAGVQGVIGTYLWRIARGEQIEIWGDGSIVRDFIHVRDLAELCARTLTSDVSGTFNAGCGQGVSIADVVSVVARVVGCDLSPEYKHGRTFDVPRVVLDISRAKTAFKWAPRIALTDGIAETWSWVRDRHWSHAASNESPSVGMRGKQCVEVPASVSESSEG